MDCSFDLGDMGWSCYQMSLCLNYVPELCHQRGCSGTETLVTSLQKSIEMSIFNSLGYREDPVTYGLISFTLFTQILYFAYIFSK